MILGGSVEMPENSCLRCGYSSDRGAVVDSPITKPRPSDVTLCIHCGEVMMFDDDLKFRHLTQDDVIRIMADTELMFNIVMAKQALIEVKKRKIA